MAFSDYRNSDQVIERFRLRTVREEFVPDSQPPELDGRFRDQIELVWREYPFQRSDAAASQALIFPILFETWKVFREHLILLSQESLRFDAELCGTADFVVAKRSPLGPTIPDRPFLLIGEAKNDEFYRGWGQALSAMVAVRKMQPDVAGTIFGMATSGMFWQFGKLEKDAFTLDSRPFTPSRLDELMAALHFIFGACRDQVLNLPTAA